MGDPGASFSNYPRGVQYPRGGFDIFRSQISYSCSYGEVMALSQPHHKQTVKERTQAGPWIRPAPPSPSARFLDGISENTP